MPDLARMRARTFRAAAGPARRAGRRRPGSARLQLGRVCDGCRRARPGRRPRRAVPPGGGCGEGRSGAAPLHRSTSTECPPTCPTTTCTGRCSPISTTASSCSPTALADHFAPVARIGVDDQTHPMLRACPPVDWVDAADVVRRGQAAPRHPTRWPASATRSCSTSWRWSTRWRSCAPECGRST